MHLLLKWNPDREHDTLDQHLATAERLGSTWWGCDTTAEARRVARDRLDRLQAQLNSSVATSAWIYRTGDDPESARVYRAEVAGIAEDVAGIDPSHRPPGMSNDHAFLFVELTNLEPVTPEEMLGNLELFDQSGRHLDAGSLGNQTSPLYVTSRTSPPASPAGP
jgi:hypothetical protein